MPLSKLPSVRRLLSRLWLWGQRSQSLELELEPDARKTMKHGVFEVERTMETMPRATEEEDPQSRR
jgi:hypothetical protein